MLFTASIRAQAVVMTTVVMDIGSIVTVVEIGFEDARAILDAPAQGRAASELLIREPCSRLAVVREHVRNPSRRCRILLAAAGSFSPLQDPESHASIASPIILSLW